MDKDRKIERENRGERGRNIERERERERYIGCMGFRERFVFNDVEREKHWGIGFMDSKRGGGREIEIGG